MNNKQLTILIPVYNNPLIKEALESVKKIRDNSIEVIVIDGDSTDETKQIVKDYGIFIDKYISEKDDGPYDAANKGINIANGEWIFWLAADDIVLKNPMCLLTKFDNKDTFDVVCGSILKERRDKSTTVCKSESNLAKLSYHCTLRQPATIFRKSLLIEYGGYDINYKFAADRELFLRLREHGARFCIVDDCITFFRYGGLTTSKKVIEAYKEDNRISIKYGTNKILVLLIYITRLIQLYIKKIISK